MIRTIAPLSGSISTSPALASLGEREKPVMGRAPAAWS